MAQHIRAGAAGGQIGQPVPGQPLAPEAPNAAVLPVPLAPGTPARNYREYYVERGNVPAVNRTGAYLANYRFTDGPAPATLRDQTVTHSDRHSMTFLCLVPGTGEDVAGDVVVLHRLVRYLDTPGDDPTGCNDKVLGFLGDLLPHQYPVVEVPNTAFHLIGTPVRVPTVGAMTALLPTWADANVPLGPYAEDQDFPMEHVRPRHIPLIPGRLAALLVHR